MADQCLMDWMAPLNQRLAPWCCGVFMVLGGLGSSVGAAPAQPAYRFRGMAAPQVKANPLAGDLQRNLASLREQLRQRSQPVSLQQALEQSLLHNPELAQAYAQIQQGQWSLIAIRRQWYPALSASGNGPAGGLWGVAGSRTRLSATTANGTLEQQRFEDRSRLALGLNLGWTFFDPSRSPQINAASEDLRSQELLFNVAVRNLTLQTQLAYFSLQEQVQLVESYELILAATTDQVNQVEALFNAGNASIADVDQIRTQQYQTLTLLINTYRGVIDAAASLAQAMAVSPGRLVLPADQLNRYGQWDLPLNATLTQALSVREEIQSSLALANSGNWRATALFNRYWPRFGLMATGSYANDISRSGLVGVAAAERTRASAWDGAVGIGFNWSIFDGGIAAAEAEAQQALARQQLDQSAVQRLQVTAEVERTYAAYEASSLAVQSTAEQARSAKEAANAVRERFGVGFADTTSVVQTLNQAITAAIAFAGSLREYNSSVASLYRASALWPENVLTIRDQRVQILKQR